jgi:hypothetical protein
VERIMCKTNDASKLATLNDQRTLVDDELDAVTGGFVGQLISTILKDLHDVRAAIIRNTAV